MSHIQEIAPDIYRLSIYAPHLNMQLNHFLIKDEEPMLSTRIQSLFSGIAGHGGARARETGPTSLDQLEPLRIGRVRSLESVAGDRSAGLARLHYGRKAREC